MNRIANRAEAWGAWARSKAELNLEVFESHGIGLRAPPASLPEGHLLLRVPSSLSIASSTCIDTAMAEWLRRCPGEGPHLLQKVVAYLALQKSIWTPYFKLLPSPEELSLPFGWPQEELEDLAGTSIGGATATKRRFVEAMLRASPPLEGMTPALWRSSYEWVASRALTHPETGEHVLVPILDLVNHSSTAPNARYDYDGRDFLLFATRDLLPGEQIFIDYGVRSAGEFLFKYGFVPQEPDTQLVRTYDPMDDKIRAILDVSRDPEAPAEERKELETAYLVLLQFVGGAATLRVCDNNWHDDLVVLVACEDAIQLRCIEGEYDLYHGEEPINPLAIQDLRVGEVGERAEGLVRRLADCLLQQLPQPTERTRELVEHEARVLESIARPSRR